MNTSPLSDTLKAIKWQAGREYIQYGCTGKGQYELLLRIVYFWNLLSNSFRLWMTSGN